MLLRGGAFLQDNEVNPGNPNRTFQTSVQGYKLFYIIPSTLGFKNIEEIRSPTFSIVVGGVPQDLVVKITDRRLANGFVNVNNQGWWYAIVRLGNFANSGLLATWTNTVFYKLNPGVLVFSKQGNKLSFDPRSFEVTTSWGLFSSKPAIQIKDAYFSPVTAGPVFDALNRFRREQIIGFEVKQEAADLAVRGFFDLAGAAINA